MSNYLSVDSQAFLTNISILARVEHPETQEFAEARANYQEQQARAQALVVSAIALAVVSLLGLLFAPGALVLGGLALSTGASTGAAYFAYRRANAVVLEVKREQDLHSLIKKIGETLEKVDKDVIDKEASEFTNPSLGRYFIDNLTTIANTQRAYTSSYNLRNGAKSFLTKNGYTKNIKQQ